MTATTMPQVNFDMNSTKELTAKADSALMTIQQISVVDEKSYENAGTMMREISGYQKALDDLFREHVSNAHKLHKFLVGLRDGIGDKFDRAKGLINGKMTQYRQLKEAEARKEQEAILAEQKRIADEEAKRLWAEGQRKAAQQVRAVAEAAPAPIVQPNIPKVDGISSRKTWKYLVMNIGDLAKAVAENRASLNLLALNPAGIVTDIVKLVAEEKLPQSVLLPNEKALADFARSTKGGVAVGGVKFYEDEQTISRF